MPTTDFDTVAARLLAEAGGAQHDHIKAAAASAAGAFAVAAAISRLADAAEVAVKLLAGTQAPQAEPATTESVTMTLPAVPTLPPITDLMISRAIAWQDKTGPALTLADRHSAMRDLLTYAVLGLRP